MAWITHHGTPKDLEKEFAAWWASEGRKFMTQGSGGGQDLVAAEDEGEVEDDMGSLEQEPGDDEMPQGENLQILQAAEDHAAVKSELAQLSAVAETALQDREPLSAVADTALQDKGASTDLAPAETKACADADWLRMQKRGPGDLRHGELGKPHRRWSDEQADGTHDANEAIHCRCASKRGPAVTSLRAGSETGEPLARPAVRVSQGAGSNADHRHASKPRARRSLCRPPWPSTPRTQSLSQVRLLKFPPT